MKKLKPLSGKMRQSVENYLNQNLVMLSFLESYSGVNLRSKTILKLWKFSSDENETIIWESEAKCQKPIKSKYGHRKHFKK